jgi:RimJ/RimL family protein N-acetyltransferase
MVTKIKGKSFVLRSLKLSDAQKYFECETDPVSVKGSMGIPESVKEMEDMIKKEIAGLKKKNPVEETFVIDVEGEFAGYVVIHDLNRKNAEHRALISYCMHPEFRRKGLMVNAVKLVVKYVFKKYKLKRLTGRCRTFNKVSARVLEKSGFKFEGIHRKEVAKDGKYLDNMYWAVVK